MPPKRAQYVSGCPRESQACQCSLFCSLIRGVDHAQRARFGGDIEDRTPNRGFTVDR
jgi:hypothetical protein